DQPRPPSGRHSPYFRGGGIRHACEPAVTVTLRRPRARRYRARTASPLADAAMPGIRARVASGRDLGQPAEVVGPTLRMAGALLGIGQAAMGHAQQRSLLLLDEIDLDEARPRRHRLAAVPAEAVGQAMHGYHLAEGA